MQKTLNLLVQGLILGGSLAGSALSSMAADIGSRATFTLHTLPSLTLSDSTPITFGRRFIPATGTATYEVSPLLDVDNGPGSVTITTNAQHTQTNFYHITTSPPVCPPGVNFTVTKRLSNENRLLSGAAAQYTLYLPDSTTRLYLGGTLQVDASAAPGPGVCSFNVVFTRNGGLA